MTNENLTPEEHAVVAGFVQDFRRYTVFLDAAAEHRYRAAPGSYAATGRGADPTADVVLDPDRVDLSYAITEAVHALQLASASLRTTTSKLSAAIEPYTD